MMISVYRTVYRNRQGYGGSPGPNISLSYTEDGICCCGFVVTVHLAATAAAAAKTRRWCELSVPLDRSVVVAVVTAAPIVCCCVIVPVTRAGSGEMTKKFDQPPGPNQNHQDGGCHRRRSW
jgi:hypothetical protein